MKYPLLSLLACLLLTTATSKAEELDSNQMKSQQRQLESLLSEIDQISQTRQEHDQRIIQLKHQLECNWTLIHAYEKCETEYSNSPDEHLNCSTAAKQNAQTCISRKQIE